MKLSGWPLVVAAGSALLVLAVPMLMVMVLLGGTQEVTSGCTPRGGSVILAASDVEEQLDERQLEVAGTIIATGRDRGMSDQAITIALAVARQESGFRNYANDGKGNDLRPNQQGIEKSLELPHDAVGTDHGSLGVFQQQWPWWGTMAELMDPATAAAKFYDALTKVDGWDTMPLTQAAQAVQKSAYPDAYADDETLAAQLLEAAGEASRASNAVYYGGMGDDCGPTGEVFGGVVFPLPASTSYVDRANYGNSGPHWSSTHTGTDYSAPCGTSVLAATAGRVTVRTDQPWSGPWLVQIHATGGGVTTWYAHMESINVTDGDTVSAGERIGSVGTEGNSTGCHLHFEVRDAGSDSPVDPSVWLRDNLASTGAVEPADTAEARKGVTLLTGNVPFTLTPHQARAQIKYLLAQRPDVLVLQEVAHRNVRAISRSLPGRWTVWQPPGRKAATVIVWNASKLRVVAKGMEPGVRLKRYERWLPWVVLESDQGVLPVVGIHMPTNSSKDPRMRRHYQQMTMRYQQLINELSDAGYPPVVGGDWNHPLHKAREPWSPVPMLQRVALTTNWQHGRPCVGTSARNGKIDGFAYNPRYVQVTDQGCLERRASDHRPVWIDVAPTS